MRRTTENFKMKDRIIKIETAARMTELSPETIKKWVRQRRIRSYKFGRAVRIKESDLLKFAKELPSRQEIVAF